MRWTAGGYRTVSVLWRTARWFSAAVCFALIVGILGLAFSAKVVRSERFGLWTLLAAQGGRLTIILVDAPGGVEDFGWTPSGAIPGVLKDVSSEMLSEYLLKKDLAKKRRDLALARPMDDVSAARREDEIELVATTLGLSERAIQAFPKRFNRAVGQGLVRPVVVGRYRTEWGRVRVLSLLYWPILAVTSICAVGALAPEVRRLGFRMRIAAGHCGRCGYDLTKNESGVCPECGVIVDCGLRNAESEVGRGDPDAKAEAVIRRRSV